MHNLLDFSEYTDQPLTGESTVLLWSRPTGYFISKLGFLSDFDSVNIVGIKEK